jgi:hypothetical protein
VLGELFSSSLARSNWENMFVAIKYRKLELTDDSATLQYLWRLDSTYTANPDSLQTYVANQERLKRQRLELLNHIRVTLFRFKEANNIL